MFTTLASFHASWQYESESTQKLLDRLTDASLSHPLYPGGRTVGRLAWHIAQSIPEMLHRTGLAVAGAGEHDAVPAHAADISAAYRTAAASLSEQLRAHWTDATLLDTDDALSFPRPGMGPLGGINAALHHADAHGYSEVLTCGVDCGGLAPDVRAELTPAPAYAADQPVIGLWPASAAPAMASAPSGIATTIGPTPAAASASTSIGSPTRVPVPWAST